MQAKPPLLLPYLLAILLIFARSGLSNTNPADVDALQNLYISLNSPSQLTGWSANGGDPCGQSWKGIQCSGSAVTKIILSGLGLTGGLGYKLTQLTSVTDMDLSNNHISGGIPYQLPPNLQSLNFASNNFGLGNLPYSISSMANLTYLNLSGNQLSGAINDVFQKLGSLSTLDMSFNTLTGSLPQGLSSLSSLSTLYLQNNQLSGDLNVLANLPLQNLNVENNQFTGWIPSSFSSIPNLKDGGNNFNTSPAPPPPPYTPPPPSHRNPSNPTHNNPSGSGKQSQGSGHTGLNGGAIAGIVIACILAIIVAVLIACFFLSRTRSDTLDEEKQQSTTSVLGHFNESAATDSKETRDPELPQESLVEVFLKPPPLERMKAPGDKLNGRKAGGKRTKSPIVATTFSVADLQLATNSFCQENLIGEGSLARVYRAEMPNGKLLAVKKIDSSSSCIQKDDEILEVISNLSRLRHANIAELVGYCTEHGQRLLVYEYFSKGTLHDLLHTADDNCKGDLTWNARVKIALGTARALEYLHEVCLPAVVHKNLKSANILLDDELNPHLSDCGIAAFSPSPERQVSTQMMGSFGYSAPEYAMSGIYTVKSDVYSFGVVTLELLTGRKPLDSTRPRTEQSLVRWATPQLHDIDALAKMVDPTLKGMYPAKSLSRFADIIALCVQPEPEFRPPMSEVVQSLVRLMQRATLNKRRPGEEQRSLDNHDLDPSI